MRRTRPMPAPTNSFGHRPNSADRRYVHQLITMAIVVLAAGPACDWPGSAPEPTSIKLNLTTLEFVSLQDVSQLRAEVYDQNGEVLAGHAVSWSTSDGTVASVDQMGLVRAEGAGMARITAAAGSASAHATVTVVLLTDNEALAGIYNATGGEQWIRRDGWLSDAPLSDWYGVQTDSDGRVVGLDLSVNGLRGSLPPEIGHLAELRELRLYANILLGPIPPQIGHLSELRELDLRLNGLSGPIPPEIGFLTQLEVLYLSYNLLSGPIPPEIGNLRELQELVLFRNELSGSIPSEIGGLGQLRYLDISQNDLSGALPREIGNLAQLAELLLQDNSLAGTIPPEIGDLTRLRALWLQRNELSGPIPPELGNLSRLYRANLSDNELTGGISGELGGLRSLSRLYLHNNKLSGEIQEEFGYLPALIDLWIGGNDFVGEFPVVLTRLPRLYRLMLAGNPYSGTLPDEIGDMGNLAILLLTDTGLSGLLPPGMTRLDGLLELMAAGTGLCAPEDATFQMWLERVPKRRIPSCEEPEEGSVAYLTQAVQSMTYKVPLVAGEEALLRVFVVAPSAAGDTIPSVRATFYLDGEEVEVVEIGRGSSIIGEEVNEGSLQASANGLVPGPVIQPGLEMVIEIDPDRTLDPGLGVAKRIPAVGRMAVNVRALPELEFTLVPFLWSENPDSAILDITEDLSPEDELLRDIGDLLPVAEMDLNVHEPVVTTSNRAHSMLEQTWTIRTAEGGTGYFMGTMSGQVSGARGVATVPGWVSFAIPDPWVMAHELGHNLSLYHAPCGGAGNPDVSFPQPDGSIGAWGYDFPTGTLVRPSVPDLMSYCEPAWISDLYFTHSLRYRLVWETAERSVSPAAPTLSLLISGGIGEDGRPYLGPAFVIDAPPSLPRSSGAYRLRGTTANGAELFSLAFEMPVIADVEDRGSFAFAVPAREAWASDLARITLSGPNGSFALDADTDRPTAILRDPRTGRVRGFFTDLPAGVTAKDVREGLVPIARGLELLFSRGIPDAVMWRR